MPTPRKVALVLSGGGMFGAYQAGAWAALSEFLAPTIIVGASIGSLNGWAISGGCSPDYLPNAWSSLDMRDAQRLRFPRHPLDGCLGSDFVEGWSQDLVRDFQPRTEFGVVLTELVRLRPALFRSPDVTWRHLAGSCAVPVFLRQQRISGRVYSDGGLLQGLPMWAAHEMGAEVVIGVNIVPRMPLPIRAFVGTMRAASPHRARLRGNPRDIVISPSIPLGRYSDAVRHSAANAERWIEAARKDIERWKPTILEALES